jgi:hypothetical protein
MNKRATAWKDSSSFDLLCNAIMARLEERFKPPLPSKQWVVGSNPTRETTF